MLPSKKKEPFLQKYSTPGVVPAMKHRSLGHLCGIQDYWTGEQQHGAENSLCVKYAKYKGTLQPPGPLGREMT